MLQPFNCTTPDWAPLERAVKLAKLPVGRTMAAFMWMTEDTQGVHQYKHRDTRRYLRLTIDTSTPACKRDLREVTRA